MADAIGQVLSLGVGVALSPVPIIAVVLMLSTRRARVNGPMFVLGWIVGLGVVGTIVLVAAGGADASGDAEPATWVGVLEIVLGLLLALVAVRQWRGRPRAGEEAGLPKWMRTIDTFTPGRSAGIAVALSAINPKNLLLTLAVFVLVGTLGPGAPVAIYFALGDRARSMLEGLKGWMGAHNAAIMAVLCLVIGAKLIGDGISGLG
jgi:threonine/homoserine/homoserine lactone efflux protein